LRKNWESELDVRAELKEVVENVDFLPEVLIRDKKAFALGVARGKNGRSLPFVFRYNLDQKQFSKVIFGEDDCRKFLFSGSFDNATEAGSVAFGKLRELWPFLVKDVAVPEGADSKRAVSMKPTTAEVPGRARVSSRRIFSNAAFGNIRGRLHRVKGGLNDLIKHLFAEGKDVTKEEEFAGEKSADAIEKRVSELLAKLDYDDLSRRDKISLKLRKVLTLGRSGIWEKGEFNRKKEDLRIFDIYYLDSGKNLFWVNRLRWFGIIFDLLPERLQNFLSKLVPWAYAAAHYGVKLIRAVPWRYIGTTAARYGTNLMRCYVPAGFAKRASPDQLFEVEFHEALHTLGFSHRQALNIARKKDISYGAQELMDELAKEDKSRNVFQTAPFHISEKILRWYRKGKLKKHQRELQNYELDAEQLKEKMDRVSGKLGYEMCELNDERDISALKWKTPREIQDSLKRDNYYYKVLSQKYRKEMLQRIEILREVRVVLPDGKRQPLFEYLQNIPNVRSVRVWGSYLFAPNPRDLDILIITKGKEKLKKLPKQELVFPKTASVKPEKLGAVKMGVEALKNDPKQITSSWGSGVTLFGNDLLTIRPSSVNLLRRARRFVESKAARGEIEGKPASTALSRLITANSLLNEMGYYPNVRRIIAEQLSLLSRFSKEEITEDRAWKEVNRLRREAAKRVEQAEDILLLDLVKRELPWLVTKKDLKKRMVTFAMLKPDVKAKSRQDIIDDLKQAGFEVTWVGEPRVLSRSQAELFYAENRDKVEKKIFEGMVRYISNGEVVPIVLFGERDCWKKLKALIGHYRGEQLGTLRNKYGTERIDGMIYNRIHTPDSFENTLREMCIVFDSRELKKIFSPGAKELVDELTKESDISGQLAKETPARAEKIEKEQALNPLLSFLKRLWQGLKKQLSRKERGFALISPKETPEDEGARPAIIIAGTSGSGKTTFISKLMKEHPKIFIFPRLTTTRKPRHGEIPDKDRKFVDKKTFKKKIAQDQLIMVRERHGHWYGLDKKELTRCSKQGKVLIFDTTSPETISLIKEKFPEAKLVLILPVSFEEFENIAEEKLSNTLRDRIDGRSEMSRQEKDIRIQESITNLKKFENIKANAVIVNDSLERFESNYNAFKQTILSLSGRKKSKKLLSFFIPFILAVLGLSSTGFTKEIIENIPAQDSSIFALLIPVGILGGLICAIMGIGGGAIYRRVSL
ncbi:hypothetical protein KAS33_04350, partial [bacterium]|nr:hypothetical protein [bacterium]